MDQVRAPVGLASSSFLETPAELIMKCQVRGRRHSGKLINIVVKLFYNIDLVNG